MNPLAPYLTIGKLVAILAAVGIICWQSSQIHRWHTKYDDERTARLVDRQSYKTAQREAQTLNDKQNAQTLAKQQRITDNAEKSYESDLARLRAELARRLSESGDATAQGAADRAAAPDLPNPAAEPAETGAVCISPEAYVSGAETELQLERLIQWVREQMSVDPNAPVTQ